MRKPLRFSWQILILQLLVVVVLLCVGTAVSLFLLREQLRTDFGDRADAVARTAANNDTLRSSVERGVSTPQLRALAEEIRVDNGLRFVVIADRHLKRLTHPTTSLIGQRMNADAEPVVADGVEQRNVEDYGTLGLSVRSRVPVFDNAHRVVGLVSVGFEADRVASALRDKLGYILLVALGFLGLGAAASALLTRRLHKQTLGLEPSELAELVTDREAVLHGIGEGVLAVDAEDRVTVCNVEAARLLGVGEAIGEHVQEIGLPTRIATAIAHRTQQDNLLAVAGTKVLVVRIRKVRRGTRYLGLVLTVRDRTELDALTRELDSVRGLTDGLRAQKHEFSNRLHTLAGLLHLGDAEAARDYLAELTTKADTLDLAIGDAIPDPHLRALLSAKAALAKEQGVELTVGERSWVRGTITDPILVTTVLGNLVDNAIRAAATGSRRPAQVEVEALSDGDTLHLCVCDSGEGVPKSLRDSIFTEGVSTKDGKDHGLGLALVRQATSSAGGEVRLVDANEPGALFVARLPHVLRGNEVPR